MTWEPIILAAITAIPPTLVALAAFIQARRSAEQATATHLSVNSRMDELLRLGRLEAAATATLDEKAAEGLRQGAIAVAKAAEKS